MVLSGLGLVGSFAVVAGPEHAARGKPAPDIFLAAAALLGIPPSRCVAFEDASNGVRGAVAAGMTVIGIATGEPTTALISAGAGHAASDYDALSDAFLATLGW
jgi:beta-phosphoglucomutase-like phosphatase (HAD superfamily)